MKRFYQTVEYTVSPEGACVLKLDGKPVKTPGRNVVMTFHKDLAAALCAEWEAQEDSIKPETMPLTRLLNTKIDVIEPKANREPLMAEALNFIESDLICYYADQPDDLVTRQRAAWQPVQAWFEKRTGLPVKTSAGIQYVEQDEKLLSGAEKILRGMDPYQFTAFQSAIAPLGSFILALALLDDECDPQTACDSSLIDELYQADMWGRDVEFEKKQVEILHELQVVREFLNLTGKKQLAPFAVI